MFAGVVESPMTAIRNELIHDLLDPTDIKVLELTLRTLRDRAQDLSHTKQTCRRSRECSLQRCAA
jgi:hypothetical protein